MPTRRRDHAADTNTPVIGELQAKLEQLEAAAAESESLRARTSQLESELEETNGKYMRLAADFENYKKRARQEQLEAIQFGSRELVLKLLPVVDDFHRVLDHAPEGADPNWLKGLELAIQKLEEVLALQGVTPIEAVGEPFDPAFHEAIGLEESEDHPEDTVITELRRGYRLHDRVLRPALVKVARPPALPRAEP
jgi:molecular chaperone GrpE